MRKPYKPIACALHDEYEIAIMQKKYILLKWLDNSGEYHKVNVLPKDIRVRNREEFLIAVTPDKEELCIRLDEITLL